METFAEFAGTARFEPLRKLGEGGMGVVYEARDRQLDSRVALKTLRMLSAEAILRIKTEFRSLADLHHENLVTLGELFEEAGQWFFTMELVEGVDLLTHVRPRAETTAVVETVSTVDSGRSVAGGATILPPVPAQAAFDEARLRAAMAQIARGLHALHESGQVHRDVKPSNILVTPRGRVVILDFGLIAATGTNADSIVGTVPYMAPEQAEGRPVGPAADWYALGSVMYQALVGRVPFEGTWPEVLDAKSAREPPPPSERTKGVPEDLEALCMKLLQRVPEMRPSGGEILRLLGTEVSPSLATPFVGRRDELRALEAAFDASRAGARTVVIAGESGLGKSALVRRFSDEIDDRALVLAGRCFERESVPYKAVDGVVDALSRHLSSLQAERVKSLLPKQAGALGHLFPVLRSVEPIALQPELDKMEPREQRARAFSVLRVLLSRIARARPLVITIDDFQWADADSLDLLGEILRPPEPPSLLLILTVRTGGEPERETAFPSLGGARDRLILSSLPRSDAAELARTLLASPSLGDGTAIAEEAAGHPLFIGELVRQKLASDRSETLRLDEALRARIARLDGPLRALLETVALAGAPLHPRVVIEAAQLDAEEVGRLFARLRGEHLLRSGQSGTVVVEPYHDRIRMAALAQISDERRPEIHRRLARALEALGTAAPETLAAHWQGAGEKPAAALYAEKAADEAAHALAFERAARLYRLALDLGGRSVHARMAEALANAGRAVEAAEAFRTAAEGASPEEALELRRRAAQQYLSGGRIDDGIAAIREVLAAVDLEMAPTPERALLSLLISRARLRLRGLGFRERPESALAVRDRMRIDTTYSVSLTLGAVDTIRGADFQTQNLLYALEAGEPYRVARGMLLESCYSGLPGASGGPRAQKLLSIADGLAARLDHPHLTAWARLARGYVAFLRGDFGEAHARFAEAEPIFRTHCRDVAYELDSINLFALWSQYYLGGVKELSRLLPLGVAEARDRGDLSGMTNLSTRVAHVAALADDDPERAQREADEAVRAWSSRAFYAQHYYHLYSRAQVDLYRGDGASALAALDEVWPKLEKSLLLRVQFIHVEALHLRARAALASGSPARARRDAEKIESMKLRWGGPLGRLVLAGAAAVEGDAREAEALLARTLGELESAGLLLYAAVARRRLGEILGGAAGDASAAAAFAWMAEQGIRNPSRITATLAPGFR